ncbi:MAG: PhoH family protein [Chthoniobacterales bacterium]
MEVTEAEGDGLRVLEVEKHELQRFGSARLLELSCERTGVLDVNEYVLLATREGKQLPARHLADGNFVRLNIPSALQMPKGIELRPLNAGQQCFLDALLDPDISLVTCFGQAGTGKTLLAVAAGLHLTEMRQFVGLTVSRPVVAMGNTLGFLPGTLNEKMHPWLQSIYDALEFLLPIQPPPSGGKKHPLPKIKRAHDRDVKAVTFQAVGGVENGVKKPYEKLIDHGLLEIEALCYIRGRSIPNRFFVLDEAQQLTPLEAKTIVTRMSQGSKLVLVGDPGQIDNPYVDKRSNGLVYTKNRLKAQAITAHISLTKGERSPLAQLGAGLM